MSSTLNKELFGSDSDSDETNQRATSLTRVYNPGSHDEQLSGLSLTMVDDQELLACMTVPNGFGGVPAEDSAEAACSFELEVNENSHT